MEDNYELFYNTLDISKYLFVYYYVLKHNHDILKKYYNNLIISNKKLKNKINYYNTNVITVFSLSLILLIKYLKFY